LSYENSNQRRVGVDTPKYQLTSHTVIGKIVFESILKVENKIVFKLFLKKFYKILFKNISKKTK